GRSLATGLAAVAPSAATAPAGVAVIAARHVELARTQPVHGSRRKGATGTAVAAPAPNPARRADFTRAHDPGDALEMGVLRGRLPVVIELRPEVLVVEVVEIGRRIHRGV